jgi:2-C-methyl-D-erythritol 4-phosphate cytidylyltransferase
MKEKLTAIILAAGSGERFNSSLPKPFIKIGFKPMFWYSVYAFEKLNEVKDIYIVVSPEKLDYVKSKHSKYLKGISKFKGFIAGGKSRQESVYNALKILRDGGGCEFAAIHDSARPFIKPAMIFDIFREAVRVGGAAPGISVVDTIKLVNDNDFIQTHLKREDIVAIQTPQIFDFEKIFKAYQAARKKNLSFTDDTEVYSMTEKKIAIVPGDKDLLKITYKEDLKTAKEILGRNKKIWK